MAGAVTDIATNAARRNADLMGMLVAGWGDMGLHPETFWLGYATIPAAGWNPDGPDPREAMSAFYPLFYGPSVSNMDRVYQLMSFQAQVWSDTWERMDSHARKPIWGNSDKIFQPPHPAHDRTVPLPKVPAEADLSYDGAWSRENAKRLEVVDAALPENDELLGLLQENLRLAEYNRDGLEVFVAIAHLFRQNLTMLQAWRGSMPRCRRRKPRPETRRIMMPSRPWTRRWRLRAAFAAKEIRRCAKRPRPGTRPGIREWLRQTDADSSTNWTM